MRSFLVFVALEIGLSFDNVVAPPCTLTFDFENYVALAYSMQLWNIRTYYMTFEITYTLKQKHFEQIPYYYSFICWIYE